MTTATAPAEPGVCFEIHEQAICLQCESAIHRDQIIANVIPNHSLTPTRQLVRAFCGHCNRLYRLRRRLINGVWCIEGKIDLVTAPSETAEFRREMMKLHGDKQIVS